MMRDPVFCLRCVEELKPGNFVGELSWFFETIRILYRGRLPTKEEISADISKHSREKQDKYYKILDNICTLDVDPKRIKAEMSAFIRGNIFVEAANEAIMLYNSEKHEEAYALVQKKIDRLNRVNFGEDIAVSFGSAQDDLLRLSTQRANAIRMGIDDIDKALGGGLLPGTWTTFLGASNAGKSMMMPNIALAAARQGKKVFVTVHEDELEPTKARYLSCFSGIPYNQLTLGYATLTTEERRLVDEADKLLRDHVKIKFMYTKDATVERVMDVAKQLMVEWPFDLYLCDYGQCLMSADFKKLDSIRHLHEHVYHLLKQMCLEMNIAGAGGAQVNRSAMAKNKSGADWLRSTDVSEAFGIIKKSSNVITMNRSAKDMQNNQIVFLVDKSRHGVTEVAVECVSDYTRCRVYLQDPLTQNNVSHLIGQGPDDREEHEPEESSKIATIRRSHEG